MKVFTLTENQQVDATELAKALGSNLVRMVTAQEKLVLECVDGYDPTAVVNAHVTKDWASIASLKRQIADIEVQQGQGVQRMVREGLLLTTKTVWCTVLNLPEADLIAQNKGYSVAVQVDASIRTLRNQLEAKLR